MNEFDNTLNLETNPVAGVVEDAGPTVDEKLLHELRRCVMLMGRGRRPLENPGQHRLLTILHEQKTLTQRELVEETGIRPASLSELLAKLERTGLIERTRDEYDKRIVVVTITGNGQLAVERHREALRQEASDMLCALSEDEKPQLLEMLLKLNASLASRDDLLPPRGPHGPWDDGPEGPDGRPLPPPPHPPLPPHERPEGPDGRPLPPHERPEGPDGRPLPPHERPEGPDGRPLPPHERPEGPDGRPLPPHERPEGPDGRPLPPHERPEGPDGRPLPPHERPEGPDGRPLPPHERPEGPDGRPLPPHERPEGPDGRPLPPHERAVGPDDCPQQPQPFEDDGLLEEDFMDQTEEQPEGDEQ